MAVDESSASTGGTIAQPSSSKRLPGVTGGGGWTADVRVGVAVPPV
jgi:hypothetical protein